MAKGHRVFRRRASDVADLGVVDDAVPVHERRIGVEVAGDPLPAPATIGGQLKDAPGHIGFGRVHHQGVVNMIGDVSACVITT